MIDPVTGVNNLKGMISSYDKKKDIKERGYTAVTVIEVDNFSKTNRVYSQELTQTILKKIAYLLSLHQQTADVIARTDYNQFTLIFSRDEKKELFKDVENIRENISELRVESPELGEIEITVSGGFVMKPYNLPLEEAIKEAKKILKFSQDHGKNKISQVRDLARNEL
jgi:diguanylate cyclase (GGDEF)-like protein